MAERVISAASYRSVIESAVDAAVAAGLEAGRRALAPSRLSTLRVPGPGRYRRACGQSARQEQLHLLLLPDASHTGTDPATLGQPIPR